MAGLTADEKGVRVDCPSCRQRNRIPFARLADAGTCGKCGTALPPPAAPVAVPSERVYAALLAAASVPVLVDYWAPWCAPCRQVAPELEKVAAAHAGRLLVVKVDTEAVPAVGQREGIRAIPTMAVFQAGRQLARTSGARPAADIEAFVRQSVGAR